MIIDYEIREEKVQYNINREVTKISVKEILPSDQSRITEEAKFTYSALGKSLKNKQTTIVENGRKQIEAIEEHGKQLFKSRCDKEYLTILKQNEIFEELANEKIDEIQNLSKQIDFNNLIYYFQGESGPRNFIGSPLNFCKNVKIYGYTPLEKAEENKKN